MLVYANYLTFAGSDTQRGVFDAVAEWLNQITGHKFTSEALKRDQKYDLDKYWVATEAADIAAPLLYSVVLKHGDEDVRGRQWIVEAGIECGEHQTAFSLVLRTDEISSLVSKEIEVTRPRLIANLIKNCEVSKGTPGRKVVELSGERDSYRGLLAEIERQGRSYPLLLVSPTKEGGYLLDVEQLQKQLIGLAQVIRISPDFNSYEMEEVLGRYWSAWDGAINLFYPPYKGSRVHNRLFWSNDIESWGVPSIARVRRLLAVVTHNTNAPKLRSHIRPEGVRLKSLREKLRQSAESGALSVGALREQLEVALSMGVEQEQQYKQDIQRIELEKLAVEEDRDNLNEDLEKARWECQALQHQLNQAGGLGKQHIETEELLQLACRSDEPSPEESLQIVSKLYPDNCTILESAYVSARRARQFRRGRRLLDMLRRLITDYKQAMVEGSDSVARKIFTNNEFSANESETVMSSPEYRRMRLFSYKGKSVEMFRHLKVGVDDNTAITIRVHFYWDGEEKKVVVGYCGEHLPIPSH